ncbi:MAG: RNA polymerase subunit sigma-70 [Pirellulaceae bacterium]|nr:RNA polymerase subunit sigma-70 [Pirellulaceae bacterium]
MSLDDDVTAWIDGLRRQDSQAVQRLWDRYYRQLLSLAARRLPAGLRREFDEEDVALSALDSLCRGLAAGRFPLVTDRDSLWALLVVIARRKCRARLRRLSAQKRGGAAVRGQSAWEDDSGHGLAAEISQDPSPEFAVEVAEELSRLLDRLPDETTRRLAVMKLEGYTNEEAAGQLECSQTTVKRRLQLIRKTWSEAADVA